MLTQIFLSRILPNVIEALCPVVNLEREATILIKHGYSYQQIKELFFNDKVVVVPPPYPTI